MFWKKNFLNLTFDDAKVHDDFIFDSKFIRIIIVSGKQNSDYLKGLSMIGVQQIDRVVEVVEETLKGNSVKMFATKREHGKKSGGAKLDLPKIRRNPLVEIIAINTGSVLF